MPRKIPQDAESMVQVAECLPIKCEALSSKCQYNKKKGGREGRREGGKKEGKKMTVSTRVWKNWMKPLCVVGI
jgi:hypothetical protein